MRTAEKHVLFADQAAVACMAPNDRFPWRYGGAGKANVIGRPTAL